MVSDVNMPNMDGLTMAEKVSSELGNKTVNIIMLTTENSVAMTERGKAAGIKGWIVEPYRRRCNCYFQEAGGSLDVEAPAVMLSAVIRQSAHRRP